MTFVRFGRAAAFCALLSALSCVSLADGHARSRLSRAAVAAHVGDGREPPTPELAIPAAVAGAATCGAPEAVNELRACLDRGGAPDACRASSAAPACDDDGDGLDDNLEDAMLRSYAPVFAYDAQEPHFPTNAAHFVAHSALYWREDRDERTRVLIEKSPTLEGLRTATHADRRASSVLPGQGPNFWLCLKIDERTGTYRAESLVGSVEASRTLAGGIDILTVAHPTTAGGSRYVVLAYMLLYAYNRAPFDDHEGDFEGGAVFVDRQTGAVSSIYTDRHPTSNGTKLIPLAGDAARPAKGAPDDASSETVCGAMDDGVRFWDFDGLRHHPVFYVARGGHAAYGYPGATKILGVGCVAPLNVRDRHEGDGVKLVPFEDAYYTGWKGEKLSVKHGVQFRNLGERGRLRQLWSSFAGQWGCQLQLIPKSYPGPWDNSRLCRHWLTNDWGSGPPFSPSNAEDCTGTVDLDGPSIPGSLDGRTR